MRKKISAIIDFYLDLNRHKIKLTKKKERVTQRRIRYRDQDRQEVQGRLRTPTTDRHRIKHIELRIESNVLLFCLLVEVPHDLDLASTCLAHLDYTSNIDWLLWRRIVTQWYATLVPSSAMQQDLIKNFKVSFSNFSNVVIAMLYRPLRQVERDLVRKPSGFDSMLTNSIKSGFWILVVVHILLHHHRH